MSRTDLIRGELLRALETGSDVGKVLKRHDDSKSTLYSALSVVLPVAQERLSAAQEQEQAANDSVRAMLDEKESLTGRIHELESKTVHKERRLAEVDRSLDQREALLGRVDALERGGFSVEDLERLRGSLATLAGAADRTPKEAVEVFFTTFDRCAQIVSSELEVRAAQQRAKKAKAEAKQAEKASRMRIDSIEVIQRMVAQGVGEDELLRWSSLLNASGLSLEGFQEALGELGSAGQVLAGLRGEIKSSTKEQKQLQQGVQVFGERMERARCDLMKTSAEVMRAQIDLKKVRAEADKLGIHVELARAFTTRDYDAWSPASRLFMATLMDIGIGWTRYEDRDVEVPVPHAISQSNYWILTAARLKLSELLDWVLAGLLTEDELEGFRLSRP